MGCLVELLVMIDAEREPWRSHRCARTGGLGREEARGDRGHDDECREAVIVRHIGAERKARYLRVVPVDGEEDRRVAEDAEVERVVSVLPDVIAADHDVLAEGLLQAGMELVAETRLQSSGNARSARQQWIKDVVQTPLAGEHEIFVKRSLERSSIRYPQNGVGWLDVVRDANARFGLARVGQTVVKIPADAEIKDPIAGLDLVFNIEGQLLDIGMAKIGIKRTAAGKVIGKQVGIESASHRRIVGDQAGCRALPRIGEPGLRIPISIDARRIEG